MKYTVVAGFIGVMLFSLISQLGDTETLTTPLQEKEYEQLTSHQELREYVTRVSEASQLIHEEKLGTSVEGRAIPYLKISTGEFGDNPNKLTMLIFAQQHGNEPSGKEASLQLLRHIAEGDYDEWLEYVDILLVPQVNPDGSEKHERRNASNIDLNRNHFILDAPETIALRSLFHEWMPEVTLDVHEYYPWASSWLDHGYVRLFDEQFGTSTNINTHAAIRELTDQRFLPFADSYLQKRGFSFHNYLVGSPDYVRYSTSNMNDGRQSFGLLNTFSLILEGKRSRGQHESLERRTRGQVAAIESLIKFAAEHRELIASSVADARAELTSGESDDFVALMDRERGAAPLTVPVQKIDTAGDEIVDGDTTLAQIEAYYPIVVPRETASIPPYYLIPAEEENLIDLLGKHKIELTVLDEEAYFEGERYRLNGYESMRLANASYSIPDVSVESATINASVGDVLVSTRQLHRHVLATALEPRSKHGVLQYDEFDGWREKDYFPVSRIMSR